MRKRFLSSVVAAAAVLSLSVNASAAGLAVSEEELASVTSSDWGYYDMQYRSNSDGRQQLYDRLKEDYTAFWFSSEDLQLDPYVNRYLLDEICLSDYGLSPTEASEVYYTFRKDHPLFYFASNKNVMMTVTTGSNVSYYLCLVVDDEYAAAEPREAYRQQILDYISEKTAGIAGLTDRYDIAKYFHDQICRDAEYAVVYQDGYQYADNSNSAHNIIGIISEGKGVCESYAKVFQLLLNYAGVKCVFAAGDAGGSHAWDLVKLDDGRYYNFDVTWDDQYKIIYDYFARGSGYFDESHTADSSDNIGSSFMYDLPDVPVNDYNKDKADRIPVGDVNEDGVVNMHDLTTLQRNLGGFSERFDRLSADVNSDGRINMKDIVYLQRLINGYTA